MTLIAALGFAALAAPVAAQEVDCSDRDNLTQMAMSQCAALDAQRAEAAMDASFANAVSLTEGFNADALQGAQNAFLAYRFVTCRFEADEAFGGSIAPMLRLMCMTRLTEQRTVDLSRVGQP